ncbi:MAG: hypothetical protein ACOZIN_06625 [Myxococcota bacterium]
MPALLLGGLAWGAASTTALLASEREWRLEGGIGLLLDPTTFAPPITLAAAGRVDSHMGASPWRYRVQWFSNGWSEGCTGQRGSSHLAALFGMTVQGGDSLSLALFAGPRGSVYSGMFVGGLDFGYGGSWQVQGTWRSGPSSELEALATYSVEALGGQPAHGVNLALSVRLLAARLSYVFSVNGDWSPSLASGSTIVPVASGALRVGAQW